ncbi:hypothetical protein D7223_14785 [Micromonospora endolithica]|uniref:Uncharacterized protein n=1 Tax=Micromonospora endolithica TaxID=230091 RepID=A0A3A9ZCY8_9ACTN|nr:hypothetical protein D7223_14785 [Micromonospora endolithica]
MSVALDASTAAGVAGLLVRGVVEAVCFRVAFRAVALTGVALSGVALSGVASTGVASAGVAPLAGVAFSAGVAFVAGAAFLTGVVLFAGATLPAGVAFVAGAAFPAGAVLRVPAPGRGVAVRSAVAPASPGASGPSVSWTEGDSSSPGRPVPDPRAASAAVWVGSPGLSGSDVPTRSGSVDRAVWRGNVRSGSGGWKRTVGAGFARRVGRLAVSGSGSGSGGAGGGVKAAFGERRRPPAAGSRRVGSLDGCSCISMERSGDHARVQRST